MRDDLEPSANVLEKADISDTMDRAYGFLVDNAASQKDTHHVDQALLRRKIDWHIVPIMFLVYTMNLIDKVAYNVRLTRDPVLGHETDCVQYAAVMGLNTDLKLRGNDFSNTATAFFAAYLIAEIPTG